MPNPESAAPGDLETHAHARPVVAAAASFAGLPRSASLGAERATMASLFGMSNGYEQVGETPAAYQPPGSRNTSKALDLKQLQEGIASAAQGIAEKVGAASSAAQKKMPDHHRPPDTNWDQKPGKSTPGASAFQSGFQGGTSSGFGPGGGVGPRHVNPYDDPANAPSGAEKMNLGNKYAKSYSSSNPPPRPGDAAEDARDPGAAPPAFMDELGMDKEPSRKERKKKLQKIADDPGVLVDATARGDVSEIRELIVDYEVPWTSRASAGTGHACRRRRRKPAGRREGAACWAPTARRWTPRATGRCTWPPPRASRRWRAGSARARRTSRRRARPARRRCTWRAARPRGNRRRARRRRASPDAADLRLGPLHAAAAGGHEAIAEFLLERGADPAAKDAKGKTAKSIAAKKGYEDLAKVIKRAIREKIEERDEDDESD